MISHHLAFAMDLTTPVTSLMSLLRLTKSCKQSSQPFHQEICKWWRASPSSWLPFVTQTEDTKLKMTLQQPWLSHRHNSSALARQPHPPAPKYPQVSTGSAFTRHTEQASCLAPCSYKLLGCSHFQRLHPLRVGNPNYQAAHHPEPLKPKL